MARIKYEYTYKNKFPNQRFINTLNIYQSKSESCFYIRHSKNVITTVYFDTFSSPFILETYISQIIKLYHSKVLKQEIKHIKITSKIPYELDPLLF